jgi:hypothetical protein
MLKLLHLHVSSNMLCMRNYRMVWNFVFVFTNPLSNIFSSITFERKRTGHNRRKSTEHSTFLLIHVTNLLKHYVHAMKQISYNCPFNVCVCF